MRKSKAGQIRLGRAIALLASIGGLLLGTIESPPPALAQSNGSPAAISAAPPTATVSDAELTSALSAQLPALWRIGELTIVQATNTGTVIEPVVSAMWAAQVELAADTFLDDGKDGPVLFVRPIAATGVRKSLHGVSESKLFAGSWQTTLAIDNDEAIGNIGTPLAAFSGRVVVRGSDEEKAYYAQRERETHEAHAAELAKIAREREAAKAGFETRAMQEAQRHQERLAALQRQREIEAEELKRKEQEAISAARVAQQKKIVEAENEVPAIAARGELSKAALQAREREEAQRHQEALAAAQRQVEIEAEELKRKEQQELSAVRGEWARKLAEEEGRLAQIAAREETRRKEIAARESAIKALQMALKSQDRTARLAAFQSAITSSDADLRLAAIEAGFSASDPAIVGETLRHRLKRYENRTLPLTFSAIESSNADFNEKSQYAARQFSPGSIIIESIDIREGFLKGRVRTNYNSGDFSGAVVKSNLLITPVGNLNNCKISLRPADANSLDGNFECSNYAPFRVRVSLP